MVENIVVNIVVGIVVGKVVVGKVVIISGMVVIMVVGIYLVLHPFSYGSQLSNIPHNVFNSSELASYEVSFIESHKLTSIHSFPFDKHL